MRVCEMQKCFHLLDLVQVVCPSVVNIMQETSSNHSHHLQVSVVSL